MLELNFNGYAERTILTNDSVEVKIGDIIECGAHWTTADSVNVVYGACENLSGDFVTTFKCNNLRAHQVIYDALIEECDRDEDMDYSADYNAEYDSELSKYGVSSGCEEEEEIIVESGKFRVVSIETDENYGSTDDEDAMGIRTITVEMI